MSKKVKVHVTTIEADLHQFDIVPIKTTGKELLDQVIKAIGLNKLVSDGVCPAIH